MDCSYRFNNSVFKEPVMPRFEKYSILNPCSIFEKLPQPHQKFFQPPRFIVGGFVGSKVCELKNDPVTPVNYSNLFGHIFSVFTSIQDPNVKKNISMASKCSPPVVQHKSPVKMNPVAQPELPVNRIVSETSETPTKDKNCNNRTVSESSDTSWVSMNSVDSDSSRVATDTVEDCKNIQNQAGMQSYSIFNHYFRKWIWLSFYLPYILKFWSISWMKLLIDLWARIMWQIIKIQMHLNEI